MNDNQIDPKFFNMVAQNAHMLAGSTLAFATILLAPHWFFEVEFLFIVLTAIKEFWYDQNYENVMTRGSNLNDWLHYQIGWFAAGSLYCGVTHSHWAFVITSLSIGLACVAWIVPRPDGSK